MAIVSMTGFGRAEGASGGYAWAWEARSVNGRGLDVRTRVPNGFDALEPVVREAAQKRFKRGSLQIGLVLKRDTSTPAGTVNTALLDALLAASQPFVAAGRVAPPTWDGMLNVRGVLASEEATETPEARAALEEDLKIGLNIALDGLATTRAQEGAATAKMLDSGCD